MNLMGMGMPEVAVIFLVAFLVLGPSRSIGMARTAGKVIRDLKRTFGDMASAVGLDQTEQTGSRRNAPPPDRREDPPPPDRREDPPPLDRGEDSPPLDRGEDPHPKAGDE